MNTGIAYDPLGSYMGFRFSSENFYPPGGGYPFANVWFDYALTTPPSADNGYAHGINGARAMGQPMYDIFQLTTWSIERDDLGEWMFGGAQFTRVISFHPNSVFRIVGWRDGAVAYDMNTQLDWTEQLFFGAQVNAIAVDKVVMTYRFTYPSGNVLSTWFTMDDMHYELVPAPGALALLSVCGLLRHRRRS